jgi:hypothetical protein
MLTIANIPRAAATYPPAGSDYMPNTKAIIELVIYGPYGFTETIKAVGPTMVSRGTPYDPGDGFMKIDTEIISMNLVGSSSYIGPITIVESPSKVSNGTIRQQVAPQDFPADSFFDVYIEIYTTLLSPNGVLHNNDPKKMSSIITQIPPAGSTYEGPETVFLQNEDNVTVGAMLATSHMIAKTGDLNWDGMVDIFDIVGVALWFSSTVPPAPTNIDLNGDHMINIFDIVVVALHFGEGVP